MLPHVHCHQHRHEDVHQGLFHYLNLSRVEPTELRQDTRQRTTSYLYLVVVADSRKPETLQHIDLICKRNVEVRKTLDPEEEEEEEGARWGEKGIKAHLL